MIYYSPAVVETMHRENQKPAIAFSERKMCYGWHCTRHRKGKLQSKQQFKLDDGSFSDTCKTCRGSK